MLGFEPDFAGSNLLISSIMISCVLSGYGSLLTLEKSRPAKILEAIAIFILCCSSSGSDAINGDMAFKSRDV
ncbi:hypothetical protein D3C80_2223630 [compost metagenome]